MANDKKFIAKNGIATTRNVLVGSLVDNNTDKLQVTGSTNLSGTLNVTGATTLGLLTVNDLTTLNANTTIDADLVITGDLTVSGTTTTVNTETILLADNIITLNSNFTTGTPSQNAGWEVLRGSLPTSSVQWDETSDYFKLISAGTDLGRIITTADEGSGNGFDADTVDGLEASQFLRSDVDDIAAGNITIEGTLTVGDDSGPAQIILNGTSQNRQIYSDSGVIGFLNASLNYAARSDASGNWIVETNVQAGADVIGQRFVDADNNTYLLNPASTSTLNTVGIDSDLFHNGDTDTKLAFATDDISLQTGGSERLGIDNDSADFTVNVYAPRYYDSDNDSFYVDPGSTSILNLLRVTDSAEFEQATGNPIRIGDGFGTGGSATIHKYQGDLYLQYNNGSATGNLRLGGGGTATSIYDDQNDSYRISSEI